LFEPCQHPLLFSCEKQTPHQAADLASNLKKVAYAALNPSYQIRYHCSHVHPQFLSTNAGSKAWRSSSRARDIFQRSREDIVNSTITKSSKEVSHGPPCAPYLNAAQHLDSPTKNRGGPHLEIWLFLEGRVLHLFFLSCPRSSWGNHQLSQRVK